MIFSLRQLTLAVALCGLTISTFASGSGKSQRVRG